MISRIPIGTLGSHVGTSISIAGHVQAIRDQNKIVFFNVRDITGVTQVVFHGNPELLTQAKDVSLESVVRITGTVKSEQNSPNGVELSAESIEVLSKAAPELPIPVVVAKGGGEPELPTRLDYRFLDLRRPEHAKIFRAWTELERGFRNYWHKERFTQLYSPSFMNTASETGAEVFMVEYFDRKAYLAQSPQFYKQMGIASGFERVFMAGPVFRAELSFTSRHLTEFTGWDFEIGYIESHYDLMDHEEGMIVGGFTALSESMPELEISIPSQPFPRVTMVEAKKLLAEAGQESEEEHDLSPAEERKLSELIKEQHGHDFVFVCDYHKSKSAFYHMRTDYDTDRSRRADLLYRGIEITTLAQREHRPEILEKQAIEKGMDLEPLADYLGFFKYGCPPHGGGGIGPARIIMRILGIDNVREATYLPRDVKRLNP